MADPKRSAWLAASCCGALALLGIFCGRAPCFNEPVDATGPLTVRIAGPSQIADIEQPIRIEVALENKGEKRLQGRLRLAVIDDWRVVPAEGADFQVSGHATEQFRFEVQPGARTYNAHYPIHAYADFTLDGQEHTAHPILIVQVQRPDPPRAAVPLSWQPLALEHQTGLALAELPVHRSIIEVFGQPPRVLSVGWSGADSETRASLQPGTRMDRGDAREAIGVHPPWFEGRTGTLTMEYPVRLPQSKPLRLRFATAIRDHDAARGEPASDGVTFRVRVTLWDAPDGQLGELLFERHSAAKAWEDAEVALDRFAGQAIRLQLETHPGPARNTTCDQAYWAEPTLIVGDAAPARTFPPTDLAGSRELGTVKVGAAEYAVRLWPGQRGLLDASLAFVSGDRRLAWQGFGARVLGHRLDDPNSPALLTGIDEETSGSVTRWRHRFQSWAGSFDLVGEISLAENCLRAKFHLDNVPAQKPWQAVYLESVSLGRWSEQAQRVYAGHGNVLESPQAFQLAFDGHRLATSFVGFDFENGISLVQAVDVPPDRLQVDPPAREYTLQTPHAQTITIIPCADVWTGARTWRDVNGLKPSGGVEKLAGRFVFDLWGGRYGESARDLQRAFRYGLTDSVVVWHNWQRWGYDYRLPDIFPPNPQLGSAEDFASLAAVCRNHGVLFAPHDNYIDFYPDADGYSYDHIAFTQDGRPVRAWLNEGRRAQSYRWRSDRVRPPLEKNLRLLRDAYSPTAYFIDVWSSIGPYDYWTRDGQFFDRITSRDTWGEAFAWIRDLFGDNAPQISESGHDQLIGWLDGAQTNHLRVDIPPEGAYGWAVWPIRCDDAERVPWFDAAHHDRFVLHGAGYASRYAAGQDQRLHGIYSDDYITTEMLTGHPTMVPTPFGRDVVRKYWLTHGLMRAVALQRIENVEFVDGDIHRQRVNWSNGTTIWVNRGKSDWTVEGHVLPEFGFYGRGGSSSADVEAAIERRDGVIVDWSRSGKSLYVNARPRLLRGLPVTVAVESAEWKGGRNLEFVFRWEAEQKLPVDLTPFVHFVDGRGRIQFQADHELPMPTSQWKENEAVRTTVRVTVPDDLAPGRSVELRAGLFDRPSGRRAPLLGADDGTQRIRLGSLQLEGSRDRLQGIQWSPRSTEADPLLARLNSEGKTISFPGIQTDGACRVSIESGVLHIVPLPEGREFTISLAPATLGWTAPTAKQVEALGEDGAVQQRVPLVSDGREWTVKCVPGVFGYRLSGG